MSRNNLIPAGEILKVHGLDGGLVIRFDELFYFPETFPAFIFPEIDGLPVPFAVTGAEEYGENSFIVHFEEITSRDKAARYQGCKVWLEEQYLEKDTETPSPGQYTGYSFRDETSGKQGKITGFIPIPDNPLFEVETDGSSYLVPAARAFILDADPDTKQVAFRLPEGMFGTMNGEG